MASTSPTAARAGLTTWSGSRAGRRRWPEQLLKHVGDKKRPLLSPQEGWLSDGRQVLHFHPLRYDRWSQKLEVALGELIPGEAVPLLKRRRELIREQAIKLWAQKRLAGWRECSPQWKPPPTRQRG